MSNNNLNIKILYYFAHPEFLLFETKRLDLPADAAKEDLFSWYLYDRKLQERTKLSFKSLAEGKRLFKEGELNFNDQAGQFNNMIFKRMDAASFPFDIL